jgi:hypothetical protein
MTCPLCKFGYYENDTPGELCGECKKELDKEYWESPRGQQEIFERQANEELWNLNMENKQVHPVFKEIFDIHFAPLTTESVLVLGMAEDMSKEKRGKDGKRSC